MGDFPLIRRAAVTVGKRIYRELPLFVIISICWFVASIPLVTIGPATLGAYTGIISLREESKIDVQRISQLVRSQLISSTAVGLFPIVIFVVTNLYFVEYLNSSSNFALLLAISGLYVTFYMYLVLIPTFVSMAYGMPFLVALREGYVVTSKRPLLSLGTGVATLALFAATAVFTIALALLFPALAFSLHLELFGEKLSSPLESRPAQH